MLIESRRTFGMYVRIEIFTVSMGKLKRNRPLGKPRNRWEDNFRTDVQEIEWHSVDYAHLGLDRGGGGLL
jgi:hypothetical protein